MRIMVKIVEELTAIPEPEWILDRTRRGSLFWRRETSENDSRVKFRYEVEVKEFDRTPQEMESGEFSHLIDINGSNAIRNISLTCLLCIVVMLPWYMSIADNN